MRRAQINDNLERKIVEGFEFPLGVAPVAEMRPLPGYTEEFEAADGAESGSYEPAPGEDWEEWPDRFVYDVVVSAKRIRALCRGLFAMLPPRVYPILDILGTDAFREVDPYLAYDLVGIEKFLDGLSSYDDWLYEDGLVGFGAMSLDPFIYIFVDEHKIVTVRVSLEFKERVEKLLAAFDLSAQEEVRGADAVEHEHRTVLAAADEEAELLVADEIVERLRDHWNLQLNVDITKNLDAEGNELGITGWQCVVRCSMAGDEGDSYAEVLVTADSLDSAERLSVDAVSGQAPDGAGWTEMDVIRADRVTPDQFEEWVGQPAKKATGSARVHDVRWLSGGPGSGGGASGGAERAGGAGGAGG